MAFVLKVSIKRSNHHFQTFWLVIFAWFVFNFGVESSSVLGTASSEFLISAAMLLSIKQHFFHIDNQ